MKTSDIVCGYQGKTVVYVEVGSRRIARKAGELLVQFAARVLEELAEQCELRKCPVRLTDDTT